MLNGNSCCQSLDDFSMIDPLRPTQSGHIVLLNHKLKYVSWIYGFNQSLLEEHLCAPSCPPVGWLVCQFVGLVVCWLVGWGSVWEGKKLNIHIPIGGRVRNKNLWIKFSFGLVKGTSSRAWLLSTLQLTPGG